MNINAIRGPKETIYIAPEVAMKSMEEEKSFAACAYVVLPLTYHRRLSSRRKNHPYRNRGMIHKINAIGGMNFNASLSAY